MGNFHDLIWEVLLSKPGSERRTVEFSQIEGVIEMYKDIILNQKIWIEPSAHDSALVGDLAYILQYEWGWDVSKAVYLQNFSVGAQETSPRGVFFNPDGTKMYVVGNTGQDVNEYDLGTPWDVSTAVYLQRFGVVTQETSPRGVFFNPDGTKMYVTGTTGDDVNEYDLGTPWDISSAVYLQLFSVAAHVLSGQELFFKPDGTKMYIADYTSKDVNEYDLGTPWDISTAVYLQLFSVAAQENMPTALFFKPDGTKMYVTGTTGDDVNEYDLGTPWDISSAVYLQLFSVAAQEIIPQGMFFKPDGAKMYVVGTAGVDVNEYDIK